MSIRNFLDKHPMIDYSQKCVRKLPDQAFVRHVLSGGNDPLNLQLEERGEENPNRIVYFITSKDRSKGFFAQHRVLLLALQFADRFGFDPVVSYCDHNAYLDAADDGCADAFEYYFQQPCGISPEAAGRSQNVLLFQDKHLNLFTDAVDYNITQTQIDACARMQKKYVRLRPEIQRRMDGEIDRVLRGKRVLGVHFRGTDFQTNFNRHPKFITAQEQADAAKRMMKEQNCDAVFLATDSSAALDIYRDRFGERLVFFDDAFRSAGALPVTLVQNERDRHHFRLGYEALRDLHALVRCHAFVGVRSQMDFCVLITQKSLNQRFESFELLDHGINTNLKSAYQAGKKVWKRQ